MDKNKFIKVRVDDETYELLKKLDKKISKAVRMCIEASIYEQLKLKYERELKSDIKKVS